MVGKRLRRSATLRRALLRQRLLNHSRNDSAVHYFEKSLFRTKSGDMEYLLSPHSKRSLTLKPFFERGDALAGFGAADGKAHGLFGSDEDGEFFGAGDGGVEQTPLQ